MTHSSDQWKLPRRTVLQFASAGVIAAHFSILDAQTCTTADHGSEKSARPYTVQFFTPDELKLLDAAMEAIIPGDDHSPGAHAAQVPLFADLIVATSPDDVKDDWRGGLQVLAAEAQNSGLEHALAKASANERDPQTVLELFFVKLKQMTVDGYYTSRVGIHQDLQYQGNTYLPEFKGCTHAEHQAQTGSSVGSAGHRSSAVVAEPAS